MPEFPAPIGQSSSGAVADATARANGALAPRQVRAEAPWDWLEAGWRDVCAMPGVSLSYGLVFALGALALAAALYALGAFAVFPAMAGGFLLIAPFCAVGLYEASRQRSEGHIVSLADAVRSGLAAKGQLLFFGVALMVFYMMWLELALLLLMLLMGGQGLPPPEQFAATLLFTGRGLGLLIIGTAVGAALAALVFAISVVAVPMLLVRPVDVATAMRASLAAVRANPWPMALWAGLIAALIAGGIATLLAGFVVAFPLIGHATWHAYADIYGHQEAEA